MSFYKKGLEGKLEIPGILQGVVETTNQIKGNLDVIKSGQERFYARGISGNRKPGFLELLRDLNIALPTIGGIYSLTQYEFTRKTT